jgi:hypothetical protein
MAKFRYAWVFTAITGGILAKPNYQFEKRQRDLAKKNKQEEKRRQKLADKANPEGRSDEPGADSPAAPESETPSPASPG